MPTAQRMIYCSHEKRKTVHLVQKRNGIFHLILTVITGGLWLPIWLYASITTSRPECTVCGKKNWG